jgi:hypothetical protein
MVGSVEALRSEPLSFEKFADKVRSDSVPIGFILSAQHIILILEGSRNNQLFFGGAPSGMATSASCRKREVSLNSLVSSIVLYHAGTIYFGVFAGFAYVARFVFSDSASWQRPEPDRA